MGHGMRTESPRGPVDSEGLNAQTSMREWKGGGVGFIQTIALSSPSVQYILM